MRCERRHRNRQLGPLDADAHRERRAAITCAAWALEAHGDTQNARHQLLSLLRELGLAHDPHALVRIATDPKRTIRAQARGE